MCVNIQHHLHIQMHLSRSCSRVALEQLMSCTHGRTLLQSGVPAQVMRPHGRNWTHVHRRGPRVGSGSSRQCTIWRVTSTVNAPNRMNDHCTEKTLICYLLHVSLSSIAEGYPFEKLRF